MTTLDRDLLNDLGVVGDLVSQDGRIEQIEHAFLAATEQQIRSRQQGETRSAQVVIAQIELASLPGVK